MFINVSVYVISSFLFSKQFNPLLQSIISSYKHFDLMKERCRNQKPINDLSQSSFLYQAIVQPCVRLVLQVLQAQGNKSLIDLLRALVELIFDYNYLVFECSNQDYFPRFLTGVFHALYGHSGSRDSDWYIHKQRNHDKGRRDNFYFFI